MTLDTLIMLAGVFVAALPFLGFPSSWDRVLLLIVGILIIGLGVALRRRNVPRKQNERKEMFTANDSGRSEHDTI